MKGCNGPVFITPSRPGDSQDGRLFFYVPVSASVVARSGVLSSIQKAGRNGKLPDCVTSGDFQLWRDAELPQDNSAIIEKLDGKQLATVCTVLKVAAALDDPRCGSWVKQTLSTLPMNEQLAHSTDERKYVRSFVALPDDLKYRVFLEAAKLPRQQHDPLQRLFEMMPPETYAAIVSAFAASKTSLCIPRSAKVALPFFEALLSLPATPASLQTIHEEGGVFDDKRDDCKERTDAFIQVLQHHSGLTALFLGQACTRYGLANQIAPALEGLPALQSIGLGCRHCPANAVHLPAFYHSFQCLQLQRLSLHVCTEDDQGIHPETQQPCKHKQDELMSDQDTEAEHPSTHVAGLIRSATSLTSLTISTSSSTSDHSLPGPISIPALQHLDLLHSNAGLTLTLISALSAPITSLKFRVVGKQAPELLSCGLQRFPQVHSLKMDMIIPATVNHKAHAAASAAFASLHSLQNLQIMATIPDVLVVFQALACRLSHLYFRKAPDVPGIVREPESSLWPAVCEHINRMDLQHLQVSAPVEVWHLIGLQALCALTGLTVLDLQGWKFPLTCQGDLDALGQMTQLQKVRLSALQISQAVAWSCMECLGSLPLLQELVLEDRGVTRVFIEYILEQGDLGGWHRLQFLTVAPLMDNVEALLQHISALGGLRTLHVVDEGWLLLTPEQKDLFERLAVMQNIRLSIS